MDFIWNFIYLNLYWTSIPKYTYFWILEKNAISPLLKGLL